MPTPYDEVAYPTYASIETHPDRMAALGRFFGMKTAPPENCRVLEVGCGDGSNLIAMAYALRKSRFLGVDLAEKPIRAGKKLIAEAGIGNAALRAMDLRELGPADGKFDYVIAHGLYSWVPRPVRDSLLEVCRQRLAPNGIALISYNVYPGGRVRQMLREMMLYHVREAHGRQRAEEARRFLKFFAKNQMLPAEWRGALGSELKSALDRPPGGLYHDDLAAINDPVWFHEFAEHARSFGLQYVCETHVYQNFDHGGALKVLAGNAVEREQYLDFLKLRRFRQSLLCREGVALDRAPGPKRLDGLLFSSPGRRLEGKGVRFEGAHGVQIRAEGPGVEAVARTLGEVWPLPLRFDELKPYAGSAEALRQILFAMATGGFAEMHACAFPCEESVTERPRASALARLQARHSRHVVNLCHRVVELDEIGAGLLRLLDGRRDHAAIARALARRPGSPGVAEIRRCLRPSLEWMARSALLEG